MPCLLLLHRPKLPNGLSLSWLLYINLADIHFAPDELLLGVLANHSSDELGETHPLSASQLPISSQLSLGYPDVRDRELAHKIMSQLLLPAFLAQHSDRASFWKSVGLDRYP